MSAFSFPNYKDFRDHNDVLSGLLVYRFVPLSLSRGGNNERSRTVLTRLKIAVLAPMPSASVITAIATKPGRLIKLRIA